MIHASFFPYTLQFNRPAGTSRGVLHTKETYFLRITDSEQPDLYGWGECGPVAGLSVDEANLEQGMAFTDQLAWGCAEINGGQAPESLDLTRVPALAFGLEMALRDLATGGKHVLYDTDFSRGQEPLSTHGLIWMDSREGILKQIEKKAEAGFKTIKMKVGALSFAEELALMADIRKSFPSPEFSLRLDANGAFAIEDALMKLEALARFDIHFIEQPIPPGNRSALAMLCSQSPIPICLDEELIGVFGAAERRSLLETILPQHIIIKPTLLGGIAASEAWMSDADSLGIGWWINSLLESNVGLNAICQWTSTLADGRVHGLGTGQLFGNNIPSPLKVDGAGIVYDHAQSWALLAVGKQKSDNSL